MGFLDNILGGGQPAGGNNSYMVPVPFIPQNLQQMLQMPYAALTNEFEVSALCVAVLCNYCHNVPATIEMLNYLHGPRPLTPMQIQFLRDRLTGKPYKMLSYLSGTSPQNNYTPAVPMSINVLTTPYSYHHQDMVTLYITSSGADSPRQIDLRRKPSTGQWFVWEEAGLMPDVRIPVSQDPWA